MTGYIEAKLENGKSESGKSKSTGMPCTSEAVTLKRSGKQCGLA
jgi:hypothetical protein